MHKLRRTLCAGIGAAALGLGVAAVVAANGGAAAAATTDASYASAVQAAKQLVARYSVTQAGVAAVPLPKKPPTGKTLAILGCEFPSCVAVQNAAAAGAKALGWTVKQYTIAITPAAYLTAWQQILQTPPNLILYTALLPNSFIPKELATVQKLKIPAVSIGSADPVSAAMRASYIGAADVELSAKLMGAAVVASGGSSAHAVMVTDPTQSLFVDIANEFTREVIGAGGTVKTLDISSANTGKTVPGQVVDFLEANPTIKYVAFGIADFAAGVPQAIKAAGLSGIKILSRDPAASDLQELKTGQEWTEVAEESAAAGYQAIDGLARILEGVPYNPGPAGWHEILTKSNVGNINAALNTPGSPQDFLKAWHVK